MIRFVALFAFISCALAGAIPDKWEGRIINGEDTTIEDHPYQVSMQTINGLHFCGAAIINNVTVVTAAHCMNKYPPAEIKLRLGSTAYDEGGELVGISAFRKHKRFNPDNNDFDVAVIKLDTPVSASSKIRYVKLSKKAPTTGTTAIATGWGYKCFVTCPTSPKILQKVKLNIIDTAKCSSSEYHYGAYIKESMFCAAAENKDACEGDSGGPLVIGNHLVGIISWGMGCALPKYPGVFCSIPTVAKWIQEIAKKL